MKYWTCLFVLLIFTSCENSSTLEKALKKGGKNRSELEMTIAHFGEHSADSLKLRAAKFLIENMSWHKSRINNKEYFPIMDSLNRSGISMNELYMKVDSIKRCVKTSGLAVEYDIQSLSSEFLIKHISKSVDIWVNSPWYNENRFDDFCEYVLPYCVLEEKRELWLDYYESKYKNYLDEYLHKTLVDSVSLKNFCEILNSQLIEKGKMVLNNKLINGYPPLMVDNIKTGTCDDYGARMVYIMRSLGMPVCMDLSPQWSGYVLTHTWNTLLGENNKVYPFMGFDETIEQWKIPVNISCSKIFRKAYSLQDDMLLLHKLEKRVPEFLNYPFLKDVTDQYVSVCDVEVTVKNKNKSKVAYLCVFKNDWGVAHWAEIKNGKANFNKMGKNVLYFPAYYDGIRMIEANAPFILDTLGHANPLIAHPSKKQTLRLERKYPYSVKTNMFLKRMLDGRFQGSNDPEFKEYDDLHVITEMPKLIYTTVDVNTNKKYRYIRYVGASQSFTNVAEIEFLSKIDGNQLKKLNGRIIGTDNDHKIDDRGYDKENAFDGDVLTFFNSTFDIKAWVGLDLGKPIKIDQIRYLPRNDDNNIRIGDLYELVYWQNGKWHSLGKKEAEETVLLFDNCPVNVLFMLHNHTRGIEERPFTYVNHKQVWW